MGDFPGGMSDADLEPLRHPKRPSFSLFNPRRLQIDRCEPHFGLWSPQSRSTATIGMVTYVSTT